MSFILDALRRADRERESERAVVPSLHTQTAPPPATNDPARDDAPRPWLWLAAGLGGGLVLAAVWALWSATPTAVPTTPSASVPAAAASPAVPAATPASPSTVATDSRPSVAAATPPPTAATSAAEPASTISRPAARGADAGRDAAPAEPRRSPAAQATDSARTAPPRVPEPAARAQAQPRDAPPPPPAREREATARSEAPKEPAATARLGNDAAPAPAPSAGPPIRQIGELSAEQRSTLPTLAFGGAMYSAKATNRRLIVNGQLLSEGDAVAPGVTLEEIRLKSAVLRTRDLRVELGF